MDRMHVLNTMSRVQTTAEAEDSRMTDFLPLRNYQMLVEPTKFLILGSSGTGKTRIFQTLQTKGGFRYIIGNQPQLFRPRAENTVFLPGYNADDIQFSDQNTMGKYLGDQKAAAFWAGSAVLLLLRYFKGDEYIQGLAAQYFDESFLAAAAGSNAWKCPEIWMDYIEKNPEKCEDFLDKADRYLEKKDQWVFIIYDTLDKICMRYIDLFPYIRTLLSFWFSHLRRWKRLKSKIFLREDLYESELLKFSDASKMGNCCLRLEWNAVSLYRLLIKRLANARDEQTIEYLHGIPNLISENPQGDIGYIPTEDQKIIERFVNELMGKYMGNTPKKGMSYTWAPNHLQDARGALVPRPFLKLYSTAARKMTEYPAEIETLPRRRLIAPAMLQGAMREVSQDRLRELQEEYPWLERLREAFLGTVLLVEKAEFIQKIKMDLWSPAEQEQLPSSTPQGIFDMLQKLGIVYLSKDGMVNVPEIYLHGFGMKRKK